MDVFTCYVINFRTKSQFKGLPLRHLGMFNPVFLHLITFLSLSIPYIILGTWSVFNQDQ